MAKNKEQSYDPRGGAPVPVADDAINGDGLYDDDFDDEDDEEPPEIIPKMKLSRRMFGIFFFPVGLFENIRAHSGAAGPLVLIALFSVAYGALSYWYQPMVMREEFALMAQVFGKEVVALARQSMGEGNGPAQIIGACVGMLGTAATSAVVSSVVGIIVLKVMKSEVSFGKLFALFVSIASVEILGQVLTVGMSVLTYSTQNVFALSVLLPGPSTPGYYLLSTITLFTLFGMALTVTGTTVVSGLAKKKGVLAGAIIVLITYGTSTLLAARTADRLATYEQLNRIIEMMR